MDITLEQVERLREKADVSYAQAKEALEYSGGNLLDALIYLEERGMIPRPEGAYYSTRGGTSPQPASAADSASQGGEQKEKKEKKKKGGSMEVVVVKPERGAVRGLLHTLRRWLIENELEIWRKDKPVTALPGVDPGPAGHLRPLGGAARSGAGIVPGLSVPLLRPGLGAGRAE